MFKLHHFVFWCNFWQLFVFLFVAITVFSSLYFARNYKIDNNNIIPGPVQTIQTAKYTNDRLTKLPPIYWQQKQKENDFIITELLGSDINIVKINRNKRYQTILGFGCALTESSAFVFSQLQQNKQKELLDLLWSPNKGLNYTLGRIPMNSCDFSLSTYSCDDVENDFKLNYFNINRDKKFIIPFVKAVLNNLKQFQLENNFNLFFSPWSPPAWMKYNHNMNGSSKPIGLMNVSQILDSWSLFYSKFITEYRKEGINFWGLTIQNEPENAQDYEACLYTPEYTRDFIKNYLGPRIKKDHPNIKIMIYDHNRDHAFNWAKTIYSDLEASKYVDGMAIHWYSSVSDGPDLEDYDKLTLTHNLDKSKFILGTEACWGNGVKLGDWYRGEAYAKDIIKDLQHNVVGWNDWNCFLNLQGGPNHVDGWCDAPIIVDVENQSFILQLMYYFFGHFTKYITKGSIRLDYTTNNQNLLITCFLTPVNNQVVIVAQNIEEQPINFLLYDSMFGDNYYLNVTLPPRSIKTLIY